MLVIFCRATYLKRNIGVVCSYLKLDISIFPASAITIISICTTAKRSITIGSNTRTCITITRGTHLSTIDTDISIDISRTSTCINQNITSFRKSDVG